MMQGSTVDSHPMHGKAASLVILLVSQVAAMGVWFSSSSVVAVIKHTHAIAAFDEALLTSAVQLGFVIGTIGSALLSLPDRYDLRRLFTASALIAALATGLLAFLPPTGPAVVLLRCVTGMCMAGVYPVGMRLAATWARGDLGLLIGLLVGALTLGSASPHLLAATGGLEWRTIYGIAAGCAAAAAILIAFAGIGPNIRRATRIDVAKMAQAWRQPSLRLANLGYLGHMWELYAMWAWLALFLQQTFTARGMPDARLQAEWLTFIVIAAGAAGAWLGGWLADRVGRTSVTIGAMATSACCAAVMGWLAQAPIVVVVIVALVWGVSVIADSAQFSASVTELADPTSVGTLLTAQTCAGFLLTLVSIHLVPDIVAVLGWRGGFGMLAIGPALGCLAMWRLRNHPDAVKLAGGRR
ncbi:MFS transporter [Cupriavidus plantarum]|uniref:Nitrate/nitrite transporter NarK n=1 Tax=Cupriavidus plantarum TaxID=942865 RepID=A0A316EH80_9BURK|nr:MFS transporter [Cupriavidus plantarum]NYI01288.1 MFS family permease [Cupriavidus plantarum]PWK31282.1 nitrate/nitrite transporter NarK [Cupriavidus plantarum]